MEAIILAGGKAERLGDAAGGKPKALVSVAGRPLEADLAGLGADIVAVEEPEPLGRGGGLRFAAAAREDTDDVFALNGDELLDLDFAALHTRHEETKAAATIATAQSSIETASTPCSLELPKQPAMDKLTMRT